MFSSAVHQMCFSASSTLPFAVGQVQDAGLIFLSSMAYNMVESMKKEGRSADSIMSTVLVVMSICTFALGISLVVIGRLKFAIIVQYIPVPVIGGYLAFIGFFCGRAGIVMMTGLESYGLTFIQELLEPKIMMLWFPGVALGLGMYMALRTFRSPYVIPIYMFAMLGAFFTFLHVCGISMSDARDAYLIAPLTKEEPFYHAWEIYNFGDVCWEQLPRQFFRWVGMFIVVAFSSSLDVAAIEMELNKPLDYNKELQTVGVSNVISGLFGGYTGSYIFSQTIFSMRRKVSTRICGMVIAISELFIIVLPFSITSYIPRLFFGAFLTLISVDLMYEWLIVVRSKIMGIEFAVCWLSFGSMQMAGVEAGLVMGIVFSIIAFVISYAKTTAVEPVFKSSTVVRTFKERALLIENRGKLVTLSLQGHIFFGSAMKMLEDVKSRVQITSELGEEDDETGKLADTETKCCSAVLSWCSSNVEESKESMDTEMGTLRQRSPSQFMYSPAPSPMKASQKPLGRKFSFSGGFGGGSPHKNGYGALSQTDSLDHSNHAFSMPMLSSKGGANRTTVPATEFLVLDFEKVFGIDATATRSCFLMLVQTMHKANVVVVFTNMKPNIESTLRANEVISTEDIIIPMLDDALEWCEEKIITKYGPMMSKKNQSAGGDKWRERKGQQLDATYYANAFNRRRVSSDSRFDVTSRDFLSGEGDLEIEQVKSLRQILEDYLGEANESEARKHALSNQVLSKYFDRNIIEKEQLVYDVRQASSYVYFLEEGEIELVKISTVSKDEGLGTTQECIERVNKINTGGIFGESEFILNALHSTRALSVRSCIFWTLSRNNFRVMEVEHPQLCLLVQQILMKSISISAHNSTH